MIVEIRQNWLIFACLQCIFPQTLRPDYDLSDQVNLSPAGEHEGHVVEAGLQEERKRGSMFMIQAALEAPGPAVY